MPLLTTMFRRDTRLTKGLRNLVVHFVCFPFPSMNELTRLIVGIGIRLLPYFGYASADFFYGWARATVTQHAAQMTKNDPNLHLPDIELEWSRRQKRPLKNLCVCTIIFLTHKYIG